MPRYNHPISDIVREDQAKALYDAADGIREQTLVSLLWITGARPSEILELTTDDITITLDYLRFKLHTKKLGKTENFQLRERFLEIARPTGLDMNPYIETIVQFVQGLPDHSNVLEYSKRWAELKINALGMKALGKPYSPYHFRHGAVTREAHNRRSRDELMHFKGAKSMRSVECYVHETPYRVTLTKREG